jgi:hypothetical protein
MYFSETLVSSTGYKPGKSLMREREGLLDITKRRQRCHRRLTTRSNMTNKNTPKAKANEDGPIWEHPEIEILDQREEILEVIEAADALEAGLVSPESPVEAPKAPERPRTYLVKAGDTYASIAKEFKPSGIKSYEYALDLITANGSKTLRAGVEIIL